MVGTCPKERSMNQQNPNRRYRRGLMRRLLPGGALLLGTCMSSAAEVQFDEHTLCPAAVRAFDGKDRKDRACHSRQLCRPQASECAAMVAPAPAICIPLHPDFVLMAQCC